MHLHRGDSIAKFAGGVGGKTEIVVFGRKGWNEK